MFLVVERPFRCGDEKMPGPTHAEFHVPEFTSQVLATEQEVDQLVTLMVQEVQRAGKEAVKLLAKDNSVR